MCCLSSLNLTKYEEWKNTNLIYDAIWFLDGVLEEFIQKAKGLKGFGNCCYDLQRKAEHLVWESLVGIRTCNKTVYPLKDYKHSSRQDVYLAKLRLNLNEHQERLAEVYGEPLWCRGTGLRNTHLRAVAPTVSNSKLAGNVSPGIEPWAANVFTEQSAKGTFIRKNKELEKVLRKASINTKETWDKILEDGGSIQDIKELDDFGYVNGKLVRLSDHDTLDLTGFDKVKDVFKTFKEINQLELVNQAGIRQQYIDQVQLV